MSETLSVIITADNKEALKAIQDTIKGTEGLEAKFKKVGSSSNEANQALINSGRVLQDLNYGFMGIANNLNPLLESFQRLGDKTKENGSIWKELKSSLMGAGGIGLAISAMTFIILKWGDAIGDAVTKLVVANGVSKEYKETLNSIGGSFTSAVEKADKTKNAFDLYHKGIITGTEALKIYNKELGSIFGVKTDINEAEKVYKDKTAAYVEASLQRALADAASKKAAEELLKLEVLKAKGAEVKVSDYLSVLSPTGILDPNKTVNVNAKGRYEKDISESERIIESYRKIAVNATAVQKLYEKGFDFSLDPEKTKTTAIEKEVDYKALIDDNLDKLRMDRLKKRIDKQGTSYILGETPEEAFRKEQARVSYFESKASALAKKMAQSGGIGDLLMKMAAPMAEKNKVADAEEKERSKNATDAINAQNEAYKQFAQTIAQDATSAIMGLWDAMQKGEDIGKALGDMFGRLTEKIAAAVIQAAIFQLIASALGMTAPVGGASTTTTSGGGFLSTLGSLLGIVPKAGKTTNSLSGSTFNAGSITSPVSGDGGSFVLKGNDLVLALNRSNTSLNLRRGI